MGCASAQCERKDRGRPRVFLEEEGAHELSTLIGKVLCKGLIFERQALASPAPDAWVAGILLWRVHTAPAHGVEQANALLQS